MAATCTTGGYTLHECECGESYQDSETEALGHNFVEGGYGDYTWNYCTRCYTYDYGTNSADEGASTYSVMTVSTDGCPDNVELASTSTVEHEYIYASGKLLRETYGSNTLDFFYDNSGSPFAMSYNGTMYYYITNLQGDVVHLVNANGATVATYTYDPWGKVLTATGTMAEINPLRYRGYYYDTETGFYYCQSRYYDPGIGRFINADSFLSTGQGFIGYNMFAYCLNNPVNHADSTGLLPLQTFEGSSAFRFVHEPLDPYITDQNGEYVGSAQFGLTNISHGGCGVIATYNALISLGESTKFSDVLAYYNGLVGILPPFGLTGLSVSSVAGYFRAQGYTVICSDSRDGIDLLSRNADACIMYYMFPQSYPIGNRFRVNAYGAHFFEYHKAGSQYYGVNVSSNHTTSFKTPSDYAYSATRFYAVGIFIYK